MIQEKEEQEEEERSTVEPMYVDTHCEQLNLYTRDERSRQEAKILKRKIHRFKSVVTGIITGPPNTALRHT